jgi:DNA primase catalytic subunit
MNKPRTIFSITELECTPDQYYQGKTPESFPYDLIYSIFIRTPSREVAIAAETKNGDPFMARYKTIENETSLSVQFNGVFGKKKAMHLGGIYESSTIMRGTNPISKELVFDIDLKDYDRFCDCSDDTSCEKCWIFAEAAIDILHYFFINIAGLEEHQIVFFYSGKKGVHCWILAKDYYTGDKSSRTNILNLLNYSSTTKTIRSELISKCETAFINLKDSYPTVDVVNIIDGLTVQKERQDAIANLFFPRFDRAITMETAHLIKMPMILHPSTGRLCSVIDKITKRPLSYKESVNALKNLFKNNNDLKDMI